MKNGKKLFDKIFLTIIILLCCCLIAHIAVVTKAYFEILTAVPLWMQIALAFLIWGGTLVIVTAIYVVYKRKSR